MHLFSRTVAPPRTFLPYLLLAGATLGACADEVQNKVGIDVTYKVECTRRTHKDDIIEVEYTGSLVDGTVFDSSIPRGKPFRFRLGAGRVIKGWDIGLLDMCIGEGRNLTIPAAYGYGHRGIGHIPPDATLIFETRLLGIDGVEVLVPSSSGLVTSSRTATSETFSATPNAASSPTVTEEHLATIEHSSTTIPTAATATDAATTTDISSPSSLSHAIASATPDASAALDTLKHPHNPAQPAQPGAENGECRLLGPFALVVQAGLGCLALLSLVFKRWRERPRRPLKIWFFDASKQVFGSVLLHMVNLLMSTLSSGGFEAAERAKTIAAQLVDETGRRPNPCSFYLINLAIDTTIGIPILVILLRLLHHGALLTPLARPAESIRSGNYGQPPRATWWLKQSVIYFIGLLLMKLCVFAIFELLPWIAWVGDWSLRWTEGSETLQILFVMFVFPLVMNAAQYYIIDGFIKDPAGGGEQYAAVDGEDDEEEGEGDERTDVEDGEDGRFGDDDASTSTAVEQEHGKKTAAGAGKAKEVGSPVLLGEEHGDGKGSV